MKIFKLFLLLLVVVAQTVLGQDLMVSGKVTDQSTGVGLAYVYIQVNNRSTGVVVAGLTDTEGNYTIKNLSGGAYILSVSSLGYYPISQEIIMGSDKVRNLSFELTPALIPLGEVTVSSLRYNKLEREIVLPIAVVPREYFPRQSSATLSDVLAREPGLSLYRDGAWGTSVSIRGLGENRMVSLIDGNRIETATDLVAGLSLIDVNEIERVEIIKGAASAIYGTGALGGVINILSKKGQFYDHATTHGSATGIYQTVNNLIGSHIDVESGSKSWNLRLGGGYRRAGDYRTPDGVQENSGFTDQNLNASLGIRPAQNQELEILAQHYQALDVGIPGGAPFGSAATATYPEAKRQLVSARYHIKGLFPGLDDLSLRIYHQYILRDVEIIPNTAPAIAGNIRRTVEKITPRGSHKTHGLVLESKWLTGEKSTLIGGIDIWQRNLVSTREKYILQEIVDDFQMVKTSRELVVMEKPNPDSRFGSAGGFVQQEIKLLEDRLEITLGARLDRIRVVNEPGLDPVGLIIDGNNQDPVPNQRIVFAADTAGAWSWSANAGALYHLSSKFDMAFNVGRSFRSPSLEERFKYIDLGSKVRLGDPDLKPEKGLFANLAFRVWGERLQIQADGFINYLNDMIIEVPGEFIYLLNTVDNQAIPDTLPALKNANVDRALLAGFDASVNFLPFTHAVLYGKTSFVRGMNLYQWNDLPMIPPFSAGVGFRYHFPGMFTLDWTTSWHAAQNFIAPGESATDAYFLSDFCLYSASRELGMTSFQLFAGVDNVFNQSYRNHLATNRGFIKTEPGRNVYIKLAMKF